MNLIEMLQAAGIDGNKADFYLASLELGEATVASIAQKAESAAPTHMKCSTVCSLTDSSRPCRKARAAT